LSGGGRAMRYGHGDDGAGLLDRKPAL
jgi:hypothetical protein